MRKLVVLATMIAIAGCSTVSQMTPTGGSRSDGVVEMSFEYGMFNKVKLDEGAARAQATQRCQTWGYEGAEPFGGVVRQCQASGAYGCTHWFATMKFQCTGAAQPH